MDDDILNEFVAEAREHLGSIEADLLAIEDAGANIDEDLVNKVFRAAHSIKGASGFFGLERIKELAHKAETVLDLIRSRKLPPNAEITNLLLAAFDKLREMVNDPARSESADTSGLLASLAELATSGVVAGRPASPEGVPSDPDLPVAREGRDSAQGTVDGGGPGYLYHVQVDLVADVEDRGLMLSDFFRAVQGVGVLLDCRIDEEKCGVLDQPRGRHLEAQLMLSTKSSVDLSAPPFSIDPKNIRLMSSPETAYVPPLPAARDLTASTMTMAAVPEGPAPERERPSSGPAPAVVAAPKERDKDREREREKEPGPAVEGTLRVSVELLESLMNLAGELVLSRNQLRSVLSQSACRGVMASFQRINLVTSELQDAIMHTRMQPIGNVLGKFPRVVRDMAHAMKKEIQLEIRGKDVGLDKSLIEGLSDPLTHMVRNAADHGIETVEERLRTGKRATGTMRIEARHEAGQVVVEIADDGRGLDPAKIAAAAVRRGLLSQEAAASMSDKEKMDLIFLPGLSTAEKVSDVSGRGVGMDVVKTNLARLGGKIEIESEPGQGTLFRIKLPLTLAIIPSLVVSVNGERFAIPQISVVELLRIRADKIKERIEVIGDAEVLLLRDELIPIVRFADVLGIERGYPDAETGEVRPDRRIRLADRRSPSLGKAREGQESPLEAGAARDRTPQDRRYKAASDLEIVVVTTGVVKYGLVVESFHTGEEIVVKPLGRHLKGLAEYAGATIMGDGTVALIVDVAGLATKAQLANAASTARTIEIEANTEVLVDNHSYLLFYNGPEELCATPLESVVRVEKVTRRQVENIGGKRTMQYRNAFLPLVALSDVARVGSIGDDQDLAIIVARVGDREVGLLAAMPVDVVDTKTTLDVTTHRQTGIAGSAIMRDTTVLVADIFELAQTVYPEWNLQRMPEQVASNVRCQILLAEDSDFFRAQVRRYLESDGYVVVEAPDGEEAWKVLQENPDSIKAIVTDVEMPRMSGLELATRVRSDPRFGQQMPILALTSLASEEDIARGKAAGVDDYQIKLDRDHLLNALRALLSGRGVALPSAAAAENNEGFAS
jgi:two-component system, chemotaxis family, sensor kinase CheA